MQVLGTPTREEIKCMNPNYTEFKFPQIKPHPWHKVCLLVFMITYNDIHESAVLLVNVYGSRVCLDFGVRIIQENAQFF